MLQFIGTLFIPSRNTWELHYILNGMYSLIEGSTKPSVMGEYVKIRESLRG